jgi:hypothetical protein
MRKKVYKRFSILDGMAMTAATALGLALMEMMREGSPFPSGQSVWRIVQASWAFILPLTWMIAMLRLFVRRPRFRAPGVAACLMVSVVSLCILVFYSHNFVSNFPRVGLFSRRFWCGVVSHILMPHPFAATVVATWSMMALDRRWRPEPSWIDRTGRLIGIYWITAGVGIPALNIWQNWR